MRSSAVSRLGFCFAAAATILGCGGSNREAPKIPLGEAQPGSTGASGAATPRAMGGEAVTALDSGNILYRAKAYDRALLQYRRSAQLAPTESAPLLGILMVADVTKNAKLADSTLARMRALNPGGADSSAAMSQAEILQFHSGIKKAPPPPPAKKR
jgi:hypothetical protein